MCGFTLIELLIVMVIIAVLAGIALPNMTRAVELAQTQKVLADLRSVESAALQYHADTGGWPAPQTTPPLGIGFLTNDDGAGRSVPGWNGPYLRRWPSTPWKSWYRWNDKELDVTTPGPEWIIEVGLAGLEPDRRNRIADLVDRKLDDADGQCAGMFQAACPPGPAEWAPWPAYIVAPDE